MTMPSLLSLISSPVYVKALVKPSFDCFYNIGLEQLRTSPVKIIYMRTQDTKYQVDHYHVSKRILLQPSC